MSRQSVLWLGAPPKRSERSALDARELTLAERDLDTLRDCDLIGVRCLVYSVADDNLSNIRRHLLNHAGLLADHGILVALVAPEDSVVRHLEREAVDKDITGLKVFTGHSASASERSIAQAFANHDCGMRWSGQLAITPAPSALELCAEEERLLRRAFSDCKSVTLAPLAGGTTARAFRVDAVFRGPSVAPRPMPYLAKFGRRDKIAREYQNYREFGDFFIPFHLRPNLDRERCLSGFSRGLIVGNLVGGAEPLWTVVERGAEAHCLNGLFDGTLSGWWGQAFDAPSRKVTGSVAGAMTRDLFDPSKVKQGPLRRAKRDGLASTPLEMWERLISMGHQRSFRAPVHGDLHPDNILVRASDAVLIDLGSVQHGPIVADPACLEVSLAFETRPSDTQVDDARWRSDVDELFAPAAFTDIPVPRVANDDWSRRWNAARRVRILSRPGHACETDYPAAVAVYLLRRSMHEAGGAIQRKDTGRRAYALIVAERLIRGIAGREP